jgi:hypothetical protein
MHRTSPTREIGSHAIGQQRLTHQLLRNPARPCPRKLPKGELLGGCPIMAYGRRGDDLSLSHVAVIHIRRNIEDFMPVTIEL